MFYYFSVMEENLLEKAKIIFPDISLSDLEPENIAIPGEDKPNQSEEEEDTQSKTFSRKVIFVVLAD